MKSTETTGVEARSVRRTDDRLLGRAGLDEQLSDLLETIWACERQWAIDNHIDAVIKYGR